MNKEAGASLSARSDIHCYFWPHACSFLKPDGYLCLITSSQWLDAEYGFHLQEWILRNFEIVAVFESLDEPWFVGARVATAVTILKRQSDPDKRMNNIVRFAQLRRPITEILAHDGTTAGSVIAADQFRDEIISTNKNTTNERFRLRRVRQGDLWNEGVRLGVLMKKSSGADKSSDKGKEDDNKDLSTGKYHGGKWGVYLRAPDLWFRLLDDFGDHFAPLADVATVRFGVKSGKDCFFFPVDCSQKCLDEHPSAMGFLTAYGIPRELVSSDKVKMVRCGEGRGEIRPIEVEYLEPEVHSLMEVDGFTVAQEDCSRLILLAGSPREKLQGKYVLGYIEWGERQGYHKGSTCASRASQSREWYDLTGHKRGQLFWPMAQQYKHVIPANDNNLIANHNLFDIDTTDDPNILAGVLNSTWVVLSKYQYGRPVGVEGNLKTEVVDVKMMLVPDPAKGTKVVQKKIADAFVEMKQRKVRSLLSERRLRLMSYTAKGKEGELEELSDESELDLSDRRKLDDAVLQLMGVKAKADRDELVDQLYEYLREFFEWTKQKEDKANVNKKKAKRRGPAKPGEIAVQIFKEIVENEPELLRQYDPDFIDRNEPFDTFDFPADGVAEPFSDMFVPHGVAFSRAKKRVGFVETKIPEQDELVVLLANSGVRALVRVPHEADECKELNKRYGRFVSKRDSRIRELAELRTSDEDMQDSIIQSLMPLILHHT